MTRCQSGDSTDDELKFEFTQNGQKCTIDPVEPQEEKCSSNIYQSPNSNIGGCATFDFAATTVQGDY